MAEAASFRDSGLIKRTLSVLGSGDMTTGNVNGIFAIWFGLVDGETASRYAREIAADCLPPTVTPDMSSFEVLALAKAGDLAAAERKLEEVWGGMTDLGVDAFWEGFEPGQKGADQYVFYGRPFGKSLCHAWSTGPVFLLPMLEAERRKASSGVRRQ